jgi:biopolymer transport protein ExbB
MEQQQGSGLIHIFLAGGLVMWPLLAILIAAIYFTINRFMEYGKAGKSGSALADEVINLVQQGRESEALSRAESESGPVAQALATILRNRHLPIEDIERQVEVVAEDNLLRLERYLPALDTFTTLSPLLGLLGTILGMVKVFQQFTAKATDETAKQRILAGVGESLYATAFGIAIAVFCFAVYNYFAARQRAIGIETTQAATRLIATLHEKQAIHH